MFHDRDYSPWLTVLGDRSLIVDWAEGSSALVISLISQLSSINLDLSDSTSSLTKYIASVKVKVLREKIFLSLYWYSTLYCI